jgi:hypothetical protein
VGYSFDGPVERKKTMDHAQFGRLTHLKRTADLEKPAGAWNTYEIKVQGAEVTLIVNGKVANRARECEVIPGRICLTAEGDEIHFRNVQLFSQDD